MQQPILKNGNGQHARRTTAASICMIGQVATKATANSITSRVRRDSPSDDRLVTL